MGATATATRKKGMGANLLADVKAIQARDDGKKRQAEQETKAREEREAGVKAAKRYRGWLKAIKTKITACVANGDSKPIKGAFGEHVVRVYIKDFTEPKNLTNIGRRAFVYEMGAKAKKALAPQFTVKWEGDFNIEDSGNGDGGYKVEEPTITITWRD